MLSFRRGKRPELLYCFVMKVILLQDVTKLGHAGEQKEVADGFARNFLFPRKMAVHVTPGSVMDAEKLLQSHARKQQTQAAEILKTLQGMVDKTIVLQGKASDVGTLFAAIGADQIAEAFVQRGMQLTADMVRLDHPLKKTGDHTVSIALVGQAPMAWTIRVTALA